MNTGIILTDNTSNMRNYRNTNQPAVSGKAAETMAPKGRGLSSLRKASGLLTGMAFFFLFALSFISTAVAQTISISRISTTAGQEIVMTPGQNVGLSVNTAGGGSITQQFRITNSGAATLSLTPSSSGANGPDFVITGLSTSVAANSSATFSIVYTPTTFATESATFNIVSNSTVNPNYTLNLKGAGKNVAGSNYPLPGGTTAVGTGSTGTDAGGRTTVYSGIAAQRPSYWGPTVSTSGELQYKVSLDDGNNYGPSEIFLFSPSESNSTTLVWHAQSPILTTTGPQVQDIKYILELQGGLTFTDPTTLGLSEQLGGLVNVTSLSGFTINVKVQIAGQPYLTYFNNYPQKTSAAGAAQLSTASGFYYNICTAPTAYAVTGTGGCGTASIGVANSENNVTYELKNGAATVQTYASTGTGAFSFPAAVTTPGTYTVNAYSTGNTLCSVSMSGSFTVNPAPIIYNVTGGGVCGAAPIGVSNGQNTVTYELRNSANTVVQTKAPTAAGAFNFAAVSAGTYTVTAFTTAVPACTATMSGNATVANDVTAPTITCAAPIAVSNNAGVCGATVTYNVSAADNCSSSAKKVLVLFSESSTVVNGTNLQSKIAAAGTFAAVDLFNVATATPTVALLKTYDAVFFYDNSIPQDTVLLGNNLAAFMDAGGGVVTCPGDNVISSGVNFSIGGAFRTAAYRAVVPGTLASLATYSLGTVALPAHPIMAGVTSFSGTNNLASAATAAAIPASSYLIASYTGGTPLLVAREHIGLTNNARNVYFNTFPPRTATGADIMANAINWAASGVRITQTAGLPSGSVFPVGVTTNTFFATDYSGNVSAPCSFTVTVSDTTKPVIICPADITAQAAGNSCSAVVTFTAPTATDNCSSPVTVVRTAGPASGSAFPAGTTAVTYTATDSSGNFSSCTFNVIVADTTRPVINCIANITAQASSNSCAAVVTYTAPTATDNCNCATPTAIAGYTALGNYNGHAYFLSVGNNTFSGARAAATGLGGHLAAINTAAEQSFVSGAISGRNIWIGFTDEVTEGAFQWTNGDAVTYTNWAAGEPNDGGGGEDYTELYFPGAQWYDLNGSQNLGYVVEFDCTGSSITQTAGLPSGSSFPLGTTINTFTATDASGNVSVPCSFTVTVADTTRPVIVCQSNISTQNNAGSCSAAVSYTTPTATDNCITTSSVPTSISGYTLLGDSAAHRYFISTGALDWPSAKAAAVALGGHLAVITSAKENSFITRTMNAASPGTTPWIGGSDDASQGTTEGTFVWTTGEPFSYTHWEPGEPNNAGGTENYVQMYASGNWNDFTGSASEQYIVEFEHAALTVDQTAGLPSGSLFPIGVTTNTFVATDISGNQSTCSFTVAVADTSAPVITCSPNIAVQNDANICGAVVSFLGNSSFPLNIAGYENGYFLGNNDFDYGEQSFAPVGSVSKLSFTGGSGAHAHSHGGPTTATIDLYSNATSSWTTVVSQSLNNSAEFDMNGYTVSFPALSQVSKIRFGETSAQNETWHQMAGITTTLSGFAVSATDCSPTTTTQTAGLPSGSVFPVGVTTNTFVVTDSAGHSSSCSFTVTVSDTTKPVITCPAPVTKAANNDGSCTATSVVIGTATATDNCASTITITNDHPSTTYPVGTTIVTWTATDSSGNASTCTQSVTITPLAANVTQPANQVVCTGAATAALTFTTTPAIAGTVTYSWTNDNTNIGLAASGTGNIPSFTATNTGNGILAANITVTAITNCAGSAAGASKTFTITVNPTPQVDQPASQGPICNQTLSAPVTFTTTNTGAGIVTYTWTNSNTSIGLAASGTGNIPAFAVSNSSLTNTNVATITVTPHYANGGTTCNGASKTFTITAQPGSFGQITGAGNTQICAGTDGSVNINTGGVAPFNGHFVISVVSGPGTPTPSFGFNSPFAGGASIIIPTALLPNSSATPVIYKIQFLDLKDGNGCNAVPLGGQVQITVNPLPTATATPAAQTICSKGTTGIVLSSTIVNTTYTYTAAVVGGPNPLVTGFSNCNANCGTIAQTLRNKTAVNQIVRYTIIPTSESAQGCQGPNLTVDITVQPEPVGVATPATATICSGATTAVALSNQIAAGTTYTWTAVNTGATVTGFSSCSSGCGTSIAQALSTNTAGTSGIVTYTVTPTSANGCVGDNFTVVITVNPLPTATISGTTAVCRNAAAPLVTFTAANGTAPYTFTYTINSGANQTVTTTTGNSVTVAAPTGTAGTFTYALVSVKDASSTACSNAATGSAVITVNPLPTATISGTTAVCRNATAPLITFTGANATAPYTFTYTINGGANQTVTTTSGNSVTVAAPTGTAGTFTYALVSVSDASTTACSNVATGSAVVTVNPLPTATISGTTAVCVNATAPSVTFTGANATAPYTFTYTINGGANQTVTTTSGNSVTVAAPTGTAGTFTYALVSVQDASTTACSNAATGSAVITVNPLPTATISGTTAVCRNATAPLITFTGANATAPYTFTYTINGGANQTVTTTTGNSVTVAAPTGTAGTFTYALVSVKDASTTTCSNAATGSAVVTVNPLPTATISGTTAVCVNATAPSVTFTGANATAPYTFTYTINGGANQTVTTTSGNSVTVAAPTGTAGTFTYALVSVQDASTTACSNAATGSAVITVNPLPTATISGTTAVCVNATAPSVTFTGANATAPYTFTYTINGGANQTVTTTSGNSVTVAAPTGTAGTFTYALVSVKDASTTACTNPATGSAVITVNPLPTATISGTTAVCVNATAPSVTFTGANATAPYTFTYTINGGANQTVTTTSGNSVTVAAPTGTAGTFTYALVSVRDASTTACSNAATGSAVITVNPLPTATISGTTAVCVNATAPSVTFTGANATAPYTFTYTINGGANQTVTTTSGNSVTVAAPTGTAGTFTYALVSVKDASTTACTNPATGSAVITVNPLPTATISGTTAVCRNATAPLITFTGANATAPYTFTYTINGGANQTVTTTSGNSVTVAAPTGTAGTFTYALVSVKDASTTACTNPATGSAVITVNPLPTATISGTTAVCVNATAPSVTFTGANATAPYTFTYTINGGANQTVTTTSGNSVTVAAPTGTAGTFTYALVSVKDASTTACTNPATGSAVITVNPLPTATISGTTAVCVNATAPSVTFTGANATAPYTFTYTINGSANQTVTTTSGNSVTVAAPTGTAGTFTYALVSVKDASTTACTNPATGSAVITVNPLPTATIGGTTTVCQNSTAPTVTFTGANGTAPYTFTYKLNGGANQTIVSTSNTATISAPTGVAGTFTYSLVSVRDASTTTCLNAASGSAVITVTPIPVLVAARVGTGDQCPGSNIVFNVTETNGGGGTFSWTAKDASNNVLGSATGVAYGSNAVSTTLGLSCPSNTAVTFTFTPTGGTALACAGAAVTAPVINVRNIVPPTFTFSASLPTSLNVGAGAGCTVAMPDYRTFVTGTSNCGGAVTLAQLAPNAPASPVIGYGGTRTIIIRGTDACGNIADTSFVIALIDATAPTASCKPATVNLDASGNGTLTASMINNNSADNCSGVTLAISKSTFDCSNVGANTVTLTVTDASGNSSTCTATVTVNDITPPVISCWGDTTVSKGANCTNTLPDLTFRVNKADACGFNPGSVTQNIPAGTVIGASITTLPVTLTVTDKNGNFSTCTFNVTFADRTAPIVTTCAPAKTVRATAGCGAVMPDLRGGIVATDNCSGTSSITITQVPAVGASIPAGVTAVTFTLTDAANNSSTCATTINVKDSTAPVITVCVAPKTVRATAGCGAIMPDLRSGITATDNCSATTTTQSPAVGASIPAGITAVTFTVTDTSGNFTTCTSSINVKDSTAPVISICVAPKTVRATAGCGAVMPDLRAGISANDNCSTITIAQSPAVGASIPAGITAVTFTVTDTSGNFTTCTSSINVKDSTAPSITVCVAPKTVRATAGCGAVMPDLRAGISANDNCSATTTTQSPAAGASIPAGVTTITFTVTDTSGNFTTCTSSINVKDSTAPVITACVAPKTVRATAGCGAVMPDLRAGITATDNCSATTTTQSPAVGASIPAGVTAVTFTVTDTSGNFTTCTSSITVKDSTAPVISICVAPKTVRATAGCGAVMPDLRAGISANDNCSTITITQSPAVGASIPAGVTAITFTVTDTSGNFSTCTSSINVKDSTAPVITTCMPPKTVRATAGCGAVMPDVRSEISASDNCSTVTVTQSPAIGASIPAGLTTVTFTVTDTSGNFTTCASSINVKDSTAPAITCSPNISPAINRAGCTASVNTLDPVTSDNCGVASLTWTLTGATTGTSPATGINTVGLHIFNVGVTTITYTVKDAAGNTTTCSSTVTVTNTLAGSISGTATVQQNTSTTSNITFTGSGGTAPYTFTYNVSANGAAAGANQTITTTGTNVTTVPQSNAVNGQYIYTLVSVTDTYGCTGAIPADNKDTVTIVTTLVTPDYTPTVDIDVLSLAAGQSKDFVVYIDQTKNTSSTGQIVFRVSKSNAFPISFSAASGTSAVAGGTANQNDDWTITSPAGAFVVCTLKPGRVIPPFGTSVVGFTITRGGATGSNTGVNITAVITNGSGGDSNNANNTTNSTIIAQ